MPKKLSFELSRGDKAKMLGVKEEEICEFKK